MEMVGNGPHRNTRDLRCTWGQHAVGTVTFPVPGAGWGGGVSSVLGGDRREVSAGCHHKQWSRGLCSGALTDLRED